MRRVGVLGIAAILCVGLAIAYMTRQVAASGSDIIKPFTATVHAVRFTSEGVASHEETYTVAFRADGSIVTDYHHMLSNGKTVEVKMIEDASSGRRTAVDYATESTSTYPLPSNFSTMIANQATACARAATSGAPILGYQVVLVHDGHKYGNGASNVHDRWEAPALNCFALKSVDFPTREPGMNGPHNEVEVTNIVLGEPDANLFSIPQNFAERSPSERHAEFERRFGLPAPTLPQADQVYNAGRENLK